MKPFLRSEPVPATRLAAFRILVGAYAVVWLLVRLPEHLNQVNRLDSRWMPVGILAPFDRPLPDLFIAGAAIGAPILGIAFTLGWRYRITAPLFAVALLVVTTLASSWGQVFHTENLLVLHVALLALAPAADALAVQRRSVSTGAVPVDICYGWPLRLAAVIVVIAYVLAGIAKLRMGGASWMGGDVLRHLVAHDNLRKAVLGDAYSPLGKQAVAHAWLFPPMAVATIVVELGAPLALLDRRLRTAWVAGAWLFHAGVLALMAVLFPYQLVGVAFAAFFALERPVERFERWRRRRGGPHPGSSSDAEDAVDHEVEGAQHREGGEHARTRGGEHLGP